MQKTEFLTIYATYGNLDIVRQTLPSVVQETRRNDARLIVHDSTERHHGQEEKWTYLRQMEQEHGFFLILSTNLSMAHARNLCLHTGQELYAPDYIAIMEDDHGYNEGLIGEMVSAMKTYYGKPSPNGLRIGMFSACASHAKGKTELLPHTTHRYAPTSRSKKPFHPGATNSCFRCAPSQHWCQVVKGYDTDEYLISEYQTRNVNLRNYHKGFCSLLVGDGNYMFDIEAKGRGYTSPGELKLWDDEFTASDPRSRHLGKKN
jgi:hypothetical protein